MILSYTSISPILLSGYFPMHDDTQPTRVYELYSALKDGQFPVRWVQNLGYGYGYPLFNFYAPLPYYVGAGFMMLGIDALLATKIMTALGIILAGVSMWYCAKQIFTLEGAILSAILYVYAPYHGVQAYVRGSVGELWAYALLPLAIGGFLTLFKNIRLGIMVGAVGVAGVVLSHNITGFLLVEGLALIVFISAIYWYRKYSTWNILTSGVFLIALGLSLSAFFWLPALAEAKFTNAQSLIGGDNNFRNHFVYLDQLWDSPWGYAGSAPGRLDGMSFKVGKPQILIGVIGLLIWLVTDKKERKFKKIILLVSILISVFFMLSISKPLWEILPYMAYVQYPWRILVFVVFGLSLGAGGIFSILKKHAMLVRYGLLGSLLGIVLIFSGKYFASQYPNQKTASDYTNATLVRWDISKISDEYMPQNFPTPQSSQETIKNPMIGSDGIIITEIDARSNQIHARIDSALGGNITHFVAIFPQWRYFVDAAEIFPQQNKNYAQFPVSAGVHQITIYLGNTSIRSVANILSLISVVVLVVCFKKSWEINYEKKS